jgi:SNF2 family DNA or RNA helicase
MTEPEPLREYQRQGVLFLAKNPRALLCDDPGTGKTRQYIEVAKVRGYKTLVVCPRTLTYEWKKEIAKWSELKSVVIDGRPSQRRLLCLLKADIYIVSYDTAIRDFEHINKLQFDCVVLDEAQRIKNCKTLTAKTVKLLKPTKYRYVITATPLENRIDDLYSLIEFVAGDTFKNLQAGLLANKGSYSGYYNEAWGNGSERLKKMIKRCDPATIHNLLSRFMLRRRKVDVDIELPPKTNISIETPLTPEQAAMYALARDRFLLMVGDEKVPIVSVLAQLTYLREICNSSALVNPTSHYSSKLEELVPRVKEAVLTGNKVIVFSEFKRFCDIIVAALRKEGLGVSYLHGQEKDIAGQKEAFWGDNQVLVATKTGYEGHNLQCASYIYEMESHWNPARLKQRRDRAHRLGQTKPVFIYSFLTPGTVEEHIMATLHDKEELFDNVIDRPEYRQWLRGIVEPSER